MRLQSEHIFNEARPIEMKNQNPNKILYRQKDTYYQPGIERTSTKHQKKLYVKCKSESTRISRTLMYFNEYLKYLFRIACRITHEIFFS